jgi:prepilin-type N-terminal cleavage/methylation domain-containing protein
MVENRSFGKPKTNRAHSVNLRNNSGLISAHFSIICSLNQLMPPSYPFHCGPAARRRLAAFTLTELLVVLAVIALLVSLRLPALARVKTQTWITQCSGNLRQITLSFELYGSDHNDSLPTSNTGYWAWDLPGPIYGILNSYGAAKSNIFYCPSNPYQSSLWNFASSPNSPFIGYHPVVFGKSDACGGPSCATRQLASRPVPPDFS